MTSQVKVSARKAQRLQTRERIRGAAITEFKKAGMAGADVNAIVAAAGVAHGTFFFHFPSKEHVLLELESREEMRIAAEFAEFLKRRHDLVTTLTAVVDLVTDLECRFGPVLFQELLPTRPHKDEWTDHPVIVLLVGELERARGDGEVHPEVDAFYSGTFFLLGIYGVLTTTDNTETRDIMLAKLVSYAAWKCDDRFAQAATQQPRSSTCGLGYGRYCAT